MTHYQLNSLAGDIGPARKGRQTDIYSRVILMIKYLSSLGDGLRDQHYYLDLHMPIVMSHDVCAVFPQKELFNNYCGRGCVFSVSKVCGGGVILTVLCDTLHRFVAHLACGYHFHTLNHLQKYQHLFVSPSLLALGWSPTKSSLPR